MKTSIRNTWTLLLAGLLLAQIALGNANAADTTPPTLVSSSPVNGANKKAVGVTSGHETFSY